jgi:prepilin signal peptidase PulO-like enzyme (type II secretory pathway)
MEWESVLYPPCEREPGEDVHHPSAELPFFVAEICGQVEWVAEHVLNFVSVHHSHPFAPHVTAGAL